MVERELRVALLRRGARHQWMVAAWTGRPAYAALQAVAPTLWPVLWLAGFGSEFLLRPPRSNAFPFGIAALIFLIVLLIKIRDPLRLRQKLQQELRQIACAAIPSRGDKRFKRWDPNLIYPPGRWGDLALRPANPGGAGAR